MKEKKNRERNNQVVSFRKLLCISCSLLSSLSKSRHNISLRLKSKFTMKRTVFALFCFVFFSLGHLEFIPGGHNITRRVSRSLLVK